MRRVIYTIPTSDYTVGEASSNGLTFTFTNPQHMITLQSYISNGIIPKLIFQNDTYFGVCDNYFFNKTSQSLAITYFQSSNQWTPSLTNKSLGISFLLESD